MFSRIPYINRTNLRRANYPPFYNDLQRFKFDRFSRDLRTELAFGPALFGLHRPVLECMRP